MTKTTKSTSSELIVKYENKDISYDVNRYVQSYSFSKTIGGSGDSFTFGLVDPDEKWMGSWKPRAASELQAKARHWGFDGSSNVKKINFGDFAINSISIKAPPSTVSITATSIPRGKGTRTKRTQTYKKCSVRSVATIIAKRLGVKLLYKANSTPTYDILEQHKENDLVFLKRIGAENGFSIKISTKYLSILDDADLEAKPTKAIIRKSNARLKSYDFSENLTNLYKSCKIYYIEEKEYGTGSDKKKRKITHSYTFTPPIPPPGDVLMVEEQFKNKTSAKRKAQNKLREANKDATTGSLAFVGLLNVNEGDTVSLKGFGAFDGKYIIVTYSGSFSTSGTESTLEIRKCLKGY